MVVIDDFIKNPRLLTKVNYDPFFYQAEKHWWNGWWNSSANSLRHEVISYIFKDNPPVATQAISGFLHEVKVVNKDIPLHVSFPEDSILKAIYYSDPQTDSIKGGQLQFGSSENYEVINPKYNRLVIFNSSQGCDVQPIVEGTHKVLTIDLLETYPSNAADLLF